MSYLDEFPSTFWIKDDIEVTPTAVLTEVWHEGKLRLDRVRGTSEHLLATDSLDQRTVDGLRYILAEVQVLASMMLAIHRYLDEVGRTKN